MIGRISGILGNKQAPHLLVDVQGVGYEIQVSMTTYYGLPVEGEPIVLHTHFVVREDAQLLYGFANIEERTLFRTLIKVNGVGPKMALAILSGMSVSEFVRCIRSNDAETLVNVPGVGKKTAERLVVEMKDRLASWDSAPSSSLAGKNSAGIDDQKKFVEAESALISLGYKPQDAAKMVSGVLAVEGDTLSSEELIRFALKGVVKR